MAAQKPIVKYLSVPVAMRDGVRLSANVFLASERARVPAILVRTPYGKGADITPNHQAFVEHGYAIVVQDVRGRYESEGAFQPLTQEVHDGDDTLNWIARQPWSDGKIGMMGGSYVGIVQWKAALANNPHLKAIFPVVSGYDDYRDRYYSTGRRLEAGQPPGVDGGESARAGVPPGFQPSSCCICRCARRTWRRWAGRRPCTGR